MQSTLSPEQVESLLYQDSFEMTKGERVKALLKEATLTFAEGLLPTVSVQKGKFLNQLKGIFKKEAKLIPTEVLKPKLLKALAEAEKFPQKAFNEISRIEHIPPGVSDYMGTAYYSPTNRVMGVAPKDYYTDVISHEFAHAGTTSPRLTGLRARFRNFFDEAGQIISSEKNNLFPSRPLGQKYAGVYALDPGENMANAFSLTARKRSAFSERDFLDELIRSSVEGSSKTVRDIGKLNNDLMLELIDLYNTTVKSPR